MDRKQVSLLTAAGLAVATLFGGIALAVSGSGDEQPPARDTVPVGQLVDVPVSSTPSSSTEPQATVAADPAQKDTAVQNPPAPQPVVPQNDPAQPVASDAPAVVPPAVQPVEETPPAPKPTERCWMDDSDPVTYPNGREVCEPI